MNKLNYGGFTSTKIRILTIIFQDFQNSDAVNIKNIVEHHPICTTEYISSRHIEQLYINMNEELLYIGNCHKDLNPKSLQDIRRQQFFQGGGGYEF